MDDVEKPWAMNSKTEFTSPKVSVITPSLNQGQFIEETMLSVKKQNYPFIEHIIIDGGSTDNTLEILKRYEETYNMTWISEPDRGHSDAVNKGFAQAKGDIIGWINSDDLLYDIDTINFVASAFQKNKSISVLYGDSVLINENNLILRVEHKPSFRYGRLLRGCYLIQPSVFFRKTVIKSDELDINLLYAMDYEYWLRIGKKYYFYHVPRILSADRYHSARKIIAKRKAMKKERLKVMRHYGQNFGPSYYLGRLHDKTSSGWLRLKGLKQLIEIRSNEEFAFDARMGNIFHSAYRQLVMKNRNLVKAKTV